MCYRFEPALFALSAGRRSLSLITFFTAFASTWRPMVGSKGKSAILGRLGSRRRSWSEIASCFTLRMLRKRLFSRWDSVCLFMRSTLVRWIQDRQKLARLYVWETRSRGLADG